MDTMMVATTSMVVSVTMILSVKLPTWKKKVVFKHVLQNSKYSDHTLQNRHEM